MFRKLQNTGAVWREKMKTDSNFGNRNKVGYKLCCKNEDIFWEMKFHSFGRGNSLLLVYCIVKNVVQMLPLRNIKKFSARINLQIENISFYILFFGSEVVFMRVQSFVVWWRIRHKRIKNIRTFLYSGPSWKQYWQWIQIEDWGSWVRD